MCDYRGTPVFVRRHGDRDYPVMVFWSLRVPGQCGHGLHVPDVRLHVGHVRGSGPVLQGWSRVAATSQSAPRCMHRRPCLPVAQWFFAHALLTKGLSVISMFLWII